MWFAHRVITKLKALDTGENYTIYNPSHAREDRNNYPKTDENFPNHTHQRRKRSKGFRSGRPAGLVADRHVAAFPFPA